MKVGGFDGALAKGAGAVRAARGHPNDHHCTEWHTINSRWGGGWGWQCTHARTHARTHTHTHTHTHTESLLNKTSSFLALACWVQKDVLLCVEFY